MRLCDDCGMMTDFCCNAKPSAASWSLYLVYFISLTSSVTVIEIIELLSNCHSHWTSGSLTKPLVLMLVMTVSLRLRSWIWGRCNFIYISLIRGCVKWKLLFFTFWKRHIILNWAEFRALFRWRTSCLVLKMYLKKSSAATLWCHQFFLQFFIQNI